MLFHAKSGSFWRLTFSYDFQWSILNHWQIFFGGWNHQPIFFFFSGFSLCESLFERRSGPPTAHGFRSMILSSQHYFATCSCYQPIPPGIPPVHSRYPHYPLLDSAGALTAVFCLVYPIVSIFVLVCASIDSCVVCHAPCWFRTCVCVKSYRWEIKPMNWSSQTQILELPQWNHHPFGEANGFIFTQPVVQSLGVPLMQWLQLHRWERFANSNLY